MQKKFHLGITLAGAVSAGAYSAGVMDYLFQALNEWEKEKQNQRSDIPDHSVQIDVIGGASAGGMTAIMAPLACYAGTDSVRDYEKASDPNFKPRNLFFDSWVNLTDRDGAKTFNQMFETTDLKGDVAPSIFNSRFIDEIANNAANKATTLFHADNFPSFVAKDLDILLTLSSLRGVPVGISFDSHNSSKTKPSHQMSTHKILARFKLGQASDTDDFMALSMQGNDLVNRSKFLACAKATGAFPIALAPRKIEGFGKQYLKKQMGDISGILPELLDKIFHNDFPDPFDFVSVDGGTLNNEPFTEIAALMEKRGIKNDDFAMIMIDPFPNFTLDPNHEYQHPNSLENLIFPVIGTLRDQSMLKEKDMLLVSDEVKQNMIFPSRPVLVGDKIKKADGNHLACGAMGGFSGFLNRQFRVPDYFLGRHNCRNFLRFYFALPCPKNDRKNWHPIFQDWTDEMIERYKTPRSSDTDYYLPIIPSIEFTNQVSEAIALRRSADPANELNLREINFDVANRSWTIPFPQLEASEVLSYEKQIETRLEAVLDKVLRRLDPKPENQNQLALEPEVQKFESFMKNTFSAGFWGKAVNIIFGALIEKTAKNKIVEKSKNMFLQYMLKSLFESKLLKF